MSEEADQRPDLVTAAEEFAEPHGRAGQQIQRVPEGGLLWRRSDFDGRRGSPSAGLLPQWLGG